MYGSRSIAATTITARPIAVTAVRLELLRQEVGRDVPFDVRP